MGRKEETVGRDEEKRVVDVGGVASKMKKAGGDSLGKIRKGR